MSGPGILTDAGLGLVFLLGLRHGLDPDHVAVIDNMTFQAAEHRPRLAPWIGTLFAAGHSLSVGAVAVAVSAFAARGAAPLPPWAGEAADWIVIGLLLLVGGLNLRALRRPTPYAPQGWRGRLVPSRWRRRADPVGVLATGVAFGLVFDTATQAAAWGAAASAGAGTAVAVAVAAVFAAGMILTDTLDSRIVAVLLRRDGAAAGVGRYRRGVGWVIVALSFGMAGYALLTKMEVMPELPDMLFSSLGAGMGLVVVAALLVRRSARDRLAAAAPHGPARG